MQFAATNWRLRLIGAMAVAACCSIRAADDEFAKDYVKAEGTWAVTEMEMDGQDVPIAGFKDLRIVLKGKSVLATSGKETIAEGSYSIVGVKGKVVSFDLTMSAGPDKGKAFPAINEWVDDDTIRTVLSQPGKPRPVGGVIPGKGDRQAVFVIKREKK